MALYLEGSGHYENFNLQILLTPKAGVSAEEPPQETFLGAVDLPTWLRVRLPDNVAASQVKGFSAWAHNEQNRYNRYEQFEPLTLDGWLAGAHIEQTWTLRGLRWVFITSNTYQGNFGDGDEICRRTASGSGIDRGHGWVAWVTQRDASGKEMSAKDRLTGEGPWHFVKTDPAKDMLPGFGEQVFLNKDALSQGPSQGLYFNELGRNHAPTPPEDALYAWVGKGCEQSGGGALWSINQAAVNQVPVTGERGALGRTDTKWGSMPDSTGPCDQGNRLICFEQ